MPDPAPDPAAEQGDTTGAATAPPVDLAAELERWKAQARKQEDRAKANAAAAKELEDLRRQHMTDTEKAIAEAASKARKETIVQVSGQLVRAEVRAAAAGRIDSTALDVLLSALDTTAFVTEDGQVDVKRVADFVSGITPQPQEPTPPGFPDLGQGARGSGGGAPLNGDSLERALRAKLGMPPR